METLKKSTPEPQEKETSSGRYDVSVGELQSGVGADQLHRRLGNRQIQLIAIGGSIGTAIFVAIGSSLNKAGPANLLLGWIVYCCFVGLLNNCMAEMSTFMPVSGGFTRLAGKWVDDAFGFMAGWNFFIYEALLVPFEITALSIVITYWTDKIPIAAICGVATILYCALNFVSVKVYGEAEFWLSGGKLILLAIVFGFSFFTMVGANPQKDAYGFRYWYSPGAFAQYRSGGSLGNFEGFLAAMFAAIFACVGPEYIAMVAGEARHPRVYLKNGFKSIYWRFALFFIGSTLCVGIIIPYNDPTLLKVLAGGAGSGTAAASPYVIAMGNLGIDVLPHITNALLMTSIFSAGNTYAYCAIRSLYALSLEGRAPAFLQKCTKSGVPVYCVALVMLMSLLSFLQVSNSSSKVLAWLINICSGGGLINYLTISITYVRFFGACKAQGIERSTLPYRGWFQPYCGWISLVGFGVMACIYGYTSFKPWSVEDFFIYYTMIFLAPLLYVGWKLVKRTKIVGLSEVDLIWERPLIEAYEEAETTQPIGFWTEILDIFRGRRSAKEAEMR